MKIFQHFLENFFHNFVENFLKILTFFNFSINKRNQTQSSLMAHYVLALAAQCRNGRDFYGTDIVGKKKKNYANL